MASKARGLAAILVVCMAIAVAACEEVPAPTQGEQAVRTTTSEITAEKTIETSETTTETEKTQDTSTEEKPANLEGLKINTDLLEDFGLTLSELEKKYGKVVKCEIDDKYSKDELWPTIFYTYFFERGTKGYPFKREVYDYDEPFDVEGKTLPDGTIMLNDTDRWGNRIEFVYSDVKVQDLILGMDEPIPLSEIRKMFKIIHSYDGKETSIFIFEVDGDHYSIQIGKIGENGFWDNKMYFDDDMIDPNLDLAIGYYRDGNGFSGW